MTSSPAAAGWKTRNYYSKDLTAQAHRSRLCLPPSQLPFKRQKIILVNSSPVSAVARLSCERSSQGKVGAANGAT